MEVRLDCAIHQPVRPRTTFSSHEIRQSSRRVPTSLTILFPLSSCIVNDCLYTSFLMWLGIDILFVSIAGIMVIFFAPIAAGSGIPEVKCYLNGIKMPEVVRLKTVLVKTIGQLLPLPLPLLLLLLLLCCCPCRPCC